MKKLFFLAVVGAVTAFGANAQGSLKIGYTDVEYILSALPEAKQIESELTDYGQKLEAQLSSKMQDFQTKLTAYQNSAATMLPEIKADKESELQTMQQSIQKFQQDAEGMLQKKQVTLLQPVYDKIQKAIDEVRKENGFSFIFSARPSGLSVILSADEAYDISELVFTKLGVEPPAEEATNE